MSAYRERPPGVRALAAWVPCTWVRVAAPGSALITPDGCVDLYHADGRLSVAGPDTAARLAASAPGTVIAGIRLRAGAAALLLGDVPAAAIRDTQPDLDRLWSPAETAALAEAVARAGNTPEAHTPATTRYEAVPPPAAGATARTDRPAGAGPGDGWAAAAVLERALATRLRDFVPDPAVLHVVAALDSPHPPSLATLAAGQGLSERQLRRRITDAVGYGPRTLHGVLRFRRALGEARTGAAWPEVALRAGYSDQPHLTREFRRWSGHTPTTLR